MKWRCPQCGKPHERNDPPCDNCGHHRFERAVVPQATADDDREQFVWACTDCGRHHQRNNPPCSRCGGSTFEKQPLEYDGADTDRSASYLDLAGRFELAAVLAIGALLAVAVLGVTGVVDVPGLGSQAQPTIDDVPGDPATANGINLSEVESRLAAELASNRTASLDRTEGLTAMATYLNRGAVKESYSDAENVTSEADLRQFDTTCDDDIVFDGAAHPVSANATVDAVVSGLLLQLLADYPTTTDRELSQLGIDAHATPDDVVVVTIAYC